MEWPSIHGSLLERLQQGDEISWDEFYFRYAPVIRAAGRGYRFNDAECDDLVQQVMVKFFARSRSFVYRRGEVKFRTYFSRIVRSLAVDMIRRNAVRMELTVELPENSDPFGRLFMEEWRRAVLSEALDELRRGVGEKTFMAFELYGLQHRELGKVAAALELAPERIYAAKSRCIRILRRIVARHNGNDGELNLEV